jgi:methylated-DNA-protein-cysteine methyltransferase related protein
MNRQQYFEEIYNVVRQIPAGKVMSYGQIGEEVRATARTVGWAMANPPGEDIPWHRVVAADGYLSIGRRSPELAARQRHLLEQEEVAFLKTNVVDMVKHRYIPEIT